MVNLLIRLPSPVATLNLRRYFVIVKYYRQRYLFSANGSVCCTSWREHCLRTRRDEAIAISFAWVRPSMKFSKPGLYALSWREQGAIIANCDLQLNKLAGVSKTTAALIRS
jgi:hypothetical protein